MSVQLVSGMKSRGGLRLGLVRMKREMVGKKKKKRIVRWRGWKNDGGERHIRLGTREVKRESARQGGTRVCLYFLEPTTMTMTPTTRSLGIAQGLSFGNSLSSSLCMHRGTCHRHRQAAGRRNRARNLQRSWKSFLSSYPLVLHSIQSITTGLNNRLANSSKCV